MDEQRYLRSQQQQQQQQMYVQQQQQMMMAMQQQQQQQQQGRGMQSSQSSGNLRDRRFNAGITSVMGPTTPRSYENRSRTFLSQMMGSLRGSRAENLSRGNLRYDDELNQSKHGGRDRGISSRSTHGAQDELDFSNHNSRSFTGAFDESDRMFNISTHSGASVDRYYSGSNHGVSAHGVSGHGDRVGSTHGDRYLNMSSHSISSVTSTDFPIVNRSEHAVELERERAGERDAHMREQVSEVERSSGMRKNTSFSSFWPFSSFKLPSGGSSVGSGGSGGSAGIAGNSGKQVSPVFQHRLPESSQQSSQPAMSSPWSVPQTISTHTESTDASMIPRSAIPVPMSTQLTLPPDSTDVSPRTESSRGSISTTPPPAAAATAAAAKSSRSATTSPTSALRNKSLHGEEDPDSDPFFT